MNIESMFSIIDRYVLKALLANYLIGLGVMMSLYVTLDMFVNMDEFTEQGYPIPTVIRNIISYYWPSLFLYFAQLSGIITLFAAMATIARMRKLNEITAVLACNPLGGGDIQRGSQHGNPHNLVKYAGAPVEVEGFCADEDTKLLVPVRIRRSIIHVESYFSRGGRQAVDCNRDGIPFNGTDMIGASPSEEHQH